MFPGDIFTGLELEKYECDMKSRDFNLCYAIAKEHYKCS